MPVRALRLLRAAIYARVSKDEQAEHGYSLPTQLDNCRQYAVANDMHVVGEETDDYTGMRLDRPGLIRVRDLITRRQIDALVVHSSDRLTRSLAHVLLLREELKRAGVELHYVRRGKSDDTPEARMTENIEGVFNEYWREKIIEASMRGMGAKAKAGGWVGGHISYGYRIAGSKHEAKIEIHEPEAATVKRIFEWYIRDLLPLAEILKRLTAENVPSPRPADGTISRWYRGSLRRLLRNPLYVGDYKWNSHLSAHPELAIVSRETFDEAQSRLHRNRQLAKRNRKYDYLLSGMIRCSCGAAMVGAALHVSRKSDAKTLYYYCSSRMADRHLSQCTERHIRAATADALAWKWMEELLLDPDRLERGVTEYVKDIRSESDSRRMRISELSDKIEDAEHRMILLANDLASLGSQKGRGAILERIDALAGEISDMEQERDTLASELSRVNISGEMRTQIAAMSDDVRHAIENDLVSYEVKRRTFDRLGVTIALERRGEKGGLLLATDPAVLPVKPQWIALD